MLFNKVDLKPCDGRDVELKGAARSAEYIVEKESGDKRIVTVIASDESVDRDGDIIRQSGWKGLKVWEKSGAVLWSHNYSLQAVGVPHKAWVDKDKKRLMAELSFPEEYGKAYPASEAVYQGLKAGAIPAVSVGFQPMEDISPSDEDRADFGMGPFGLIFTKQELFEISPCNVASNRNALVQQVKAAGIDTRGLEEMLQHEDNFVIVLESEDKPLPDITINIASVDSSLVDPGAISKMLGDALGGIELGDVKITFEPEFFTEEELRERAKSDCELCSGLGQVCKMCGKHHLDQTYRHPYELIECSCISGESAKDIDPAIAKLNDIDDAMTLLSSMGYTITEKQEEPETLTVVIEEPMTVELDLSPEPPSEVMDEETINQLARLIADGMKPTFLEENEKIKERAAIAVKRVTDYHLGKVVEEE